MNRFVELVSTTPAKLFGLYPRKGTIAVGSDADLVIFDPNRKHTISAKTHHMRVDYSMFEGIEVTGMPDVVLSRGRVIVEGDKFLGRPAQENSLSDRSIQCRCERLRSCSRARRHPEEAQAFATRRPANEGSIYQTPAPRTNHQTKPEPANHDAGYFTYC